MMISKMNFLNQKTKNRMDFKIEWEEDLDTIKKPEEPKKKKKTPKKSKSDKKDFIIEWEEENDTIR